jgi:uncharacterized protein YjbI with pentapeptide repeats
VVTADKTESKQTATEDKTTPPSLSLHDQIGTDQLQNNQIEDTIKHLRDRGYRVIEEYSNTGQLSKVSGEIPPRKTWWDFLNLISILLIPLILGIATLLLGIQQSHLADLQHQSDQRLSQQQHEADQQSALDQQRQATLVRYLENMNDLLLNRGLLTSKPHDEIRVIARTETLSAIRQLDWKRNSILVQFLQDSQLIGLSRDNILNFESADLRGADLRGAHLFNVDLVDADLRGANLSYAGLYGAKLFNALLSGANLSYAIIGDAILTQYQLDQVYSCKDATLPKGLTCHRTPSP